MPDDFVESIPGLMVSANAEPPAMPMLDQFTLDGPPLSPESRLLVALIKRMDAQTRLIESLTAEVRGLREEQQRTAVLARSV